MMYYDRAHSVMPRHALTAASASMRPTATSRVSSQPAPATVTVSVNRGITDSTSHLELGVTHTQYSLDSWGNATAIANGEALLAASTHYQNQFIMGWGARNPEPSPGHYDWTDLDSRIKLIRMTRGTAVITLCCAPDWMTGGQAGTTDWRALGKAPTPNHYADFANLCKQVARRYPIVRYYQVWSELRGFYNRALNRWNYEGYTTMYNMVYDALKSVNPHIHVGGPYVVMVSWLNPRAGGWPATDPSLYNQPWGTMDRRSLDVISYWLAHKHGADFIAVDAVNDNRDAADLDRFGANEIFVATMAWIRRQPHGGGTLPIWWSEWYSLPSPHASVAHRVVIMAEGLMRMVESDASAVLIWQPQGDATGASFPVGLFTDTRVAGGGQQTVYYAVYQALHDDFGPGTQLYKATASPPAVDVLASATKILLVNELPTPLTVDLNGTTRMLGGYEVCLL